MIYPLAIELTAAHEVKSLIALGKTLRRRKRGTERKTTDNKSKAEQKTGTIRINPAIQSPEEYP